MTAAVLTFLTHTRSRCSPPCGSHDALKASTEQKRSTDLRGLCSHAQANVMVHECSCIGSKCLKYVYNYYTNAHHAQTLAGPRELSVVLDPRTLRSEVNCSQACASVRRAHEELCAKSAHARSEWLKARVHSDARCAQSKLLTSMRKSAHMHDDFSICAKKNV